MRNAFEEGQKRGYCGSTELEIVAPRLFWREILCGKPQHMKNSLNFANTCLKVVDTRRIGLLLIRALLRRTASQRNKDMRENQQHETQLHATPLTKWILHPRNEALQADSQSS